MRQRVVHSFISCTPFSYGFAASVLVTKTESVYCDLSLGYYFAFLHHFLEPNHLCSQLLSISDLASIQEIPCIKYNKPHCGGVMV